MYRYPPDIDYQNGFVRLGGSPGSGDPFIDLKMFSYYMPGTDDAVFGSDFQRDMAHRDFACNSVYYDPVNQAYIDPSGRGVSDSEQKTLHLVCDTSLRSPFHCAQIAVRFFKFLTRGYKPSPETADLIRSHYLPNLPTMTKSLRIKYTHTQVLSKMPKALHAAALDSFRTVVCDFDVEIWQDYFEPIREELLS
jgi:hypothetical protein